MKSTLLALWLFAPPAWAVVQGCYWPTPPVACVRHNASRAEILRCAGADQVAATNYIRQIRQALATCKN